MKTKPKRGEISLEETSSQARVSPLRLPLGAEEEVIPQGGLLGRGEGTKEGSARLRLPIIGLNKALSNSLRARIS